jgi:hypothetical protein
MLTFTISCLLLLFSPFTHAKFPQGSCRIKGCGGSPVKLTWISQNQDSFCFDVTRQDCTIAECCDMFAVQTNKFVMPIEPACLKSVLKVTINGVIKGGGVYPVNYPSYNESELHLTSLKWNAVSAVNNRICIFVKDTKCNTIEKLCRDVTGNCKFSVYDAFTHKCCPTCAFDKTMEVNNGPRPLLPGIRPMGPRASPAPPPKPIEPIEPLEPLEVNPPTNQPIINTHTQDIAGKQMMCDCQCQSQ